MVHWHYTTATVQSATERPPVHVLFRPYPHRCVEMLRWSLKSKTLLIHVCDVSSIAALLYSQTTRTSHDNSTSHSTCSFKDYFLFLLSSLWKLASGWSTPMYEQSTTPRRCGITHLWYTRPLQALCAVFWCSIYVAPGRRWQPYELVRWWQKTTCLDYPNALLVFQSPPWSPE